MSSMLVVKLAGRKLALVPTEKTLKTCQKQPSKHPTFLVDVLAGDRTVKKLALATHSDSRGCYGGPNKLSTAAIEYRGGHGLFRDTPKPTFRDIRGGYFVCLITWSILPHCHASTHPDLLGGWGGKEGGGTLCTAQYRMLVSKP